MFKAAYYAVSKADKDYSRPQKLAILIDETE